MSNQKRGDIALAHSSKPQALNAVINMRSKDLRRPPEVLWWGFVRVQISVLSNLVLFKIKLISKTSYRLKGNAAGIPNNVTDGKLRNWLLRLLHTVVVSTSIDHQ